MSLRTLLTRRKKRLALALCAVLLLAALVFWLLRPEPRPLPEIVDAAVRYATLHVVRNNQNPEFDVYTVEGTTRMAIVATADRAIVRFKIARGPLENETVIACGTLNSRTYEVTRFDAAGPSGPHDFIKGLTLGNMKPSARYHGGLVYLDPRGRAELSRLVSVVDWPGYSSFNEPMSFKEWSRREWQGAIDGSWGVYPDTLLWYYAVDKGWIAAEKPLVVLMLYREPGFTMPDFLKRVREVGPISAIRAAFGGSSLCLPFLYGDCLGPRSVGESAIMSRAVGWIDAYSLQVGTPPPPPS